MLEALIFVVFPFCMLFAAISDMLSMTIANRVPVLLVAVFALVAPLTGMDWATYGWHFAAGGLVLAVTFGLFALGGMGGGDAKLLAASAVWMGLNIHLVEYLVVSTFIGGLLTLAILVYRKSPLAAVTSHNRFLRHFADETIRRSLWHRAWRWRPAHLSELAIDGVGTRKAGGLIFSPPAFPVRPDFYYSIWPWSRRLGRLFCWPGRMPQIYVNLKLITIVSIKLTLF